jgi:acyl carrier protein
MIKEKVLEMMRRIFKLDDIDQALAQQNCPEWDSLNHLALVVEIEEHFNISLEPEEIEQMTSIEVIIQIIESKI